MSKDTAIHKIDARRDLLKLVPAGEDDGAPSARGAPETPPMSATGMKPTRAGRRVGRRLVLIVAGIGAIAVAGWYGLDYWRNGRFIVSTDDAYVGAEMATISSKLAANLAVVAVKQNQQVKAGEPLVTLDDGDWRIALESAQAKVATARAALARIDAQVEAGRAGLEQAQAQRVSAEAAVTRTAADFERANSLAAKSYGSQATLDAATAGRDQAVAAAASAKAGVAQALANIRVLEAQRVEAARQLDELEVAVGKARRDLSFTRIVAPIDGLVANINAQVGDLVSAGKRLMSVVPLAQVYVDANFKETQIGPVKIGQGQLRFGIGMGQPHRARGLQGDLLPEAHVQVGWLWIVVVPASGGFDLLGTVFDIGNEPRRDDFNGQGIRSTKMQHLPHG